MECSKMESEEDSKESGVSFKSDWLQRYKIWSSRPEDLIGADIDSVRDDEDWVESSDDLMAKGSMESIDSGVSFKSDRSKSGLIDFKDSSSLSGSDLSSYLMDNAVVHHKDWVESSDHLMPLRRTQSAPVKSNSLIPLSQQSPLVIATRSFEAFGSSLSSMNDSVIRNRQLFLPRMVLRSMDTFGSSLSSISDSFIRTGQRSPPREELNQELSSEVGWEHR